MKLLVATDKSAQADAIFDDLKLAGLPASGEAIVLAVAEMWPYWEEAELAPISAPTRPTSRVFEATRQAARHALVEAEKTARHNLDRLREVLPGWTVDAEHHAGVPQHLIVQRGDELGADLIVMAATGRSKLERLMLGSVSHAVLTHSVNSLRICRHRSNRQSDPPRLLVGVDGSKGSALAVNQIVSRTWPPGTTVEVLTVEDAFVTTALPFDGIASTWLLPRFEENANWIAQAAGAAVKKLQGAGLQATSRTLIGDPKRLLPEEAERIDADCIFVGAKGLSRLDRFLIGSVSTKVAERAPCSVEIVR